ncbi:hypothetical protein HSB1_44270 [Halogranum salarium B-1]|uniref:PGF-pre-PGF domain-containing protein n=1 Tax=Halogranum salarium B-1 TaxID=1210908 RepID=J3JCZ4_9EURY|nr:hypothetical protein HSB1_44270 [Halogranum salarium B-1]
MSLFLICCVLLGTLASVPGLAVAMASNFTANSYDVTSSETVQLTVTSQFGNDLTFAIDVDGNEKISLDEVIGTVQGSGSTNPETRSISFVPDDMSVTTNGDYTVAVWEEGDSDGFDSDEANNLYPMDVSMYDTTLTLAITVSDTTDPTATITSPTAASPVYVKSTDSFDVTYDATDAGGVSTVRLTLTDGSGTEFTDLVSGTEQTYTVPGSSLSPGTYDLTLTVTDASNNVGTVTETDAVVVDDTLPSLTGVVASNQAGGDTVAEGDTVVVSATASDALAGLASVTVDASDLGGSNALELTNSNGDAYDGTFVVSGPTAQDGSVSLTVTATDEAGNTASDSDSVTLDTTGPADSNLQITNADGGEYVTTGDEVTASITLTDELSSVVSVTLDASELGASATVPLSAVDGDSYEGTFTVGSSQAPSANDGPVSLKVSASDSAGNTATPTDSVTFDTTKPVVMSVVAARQAGGDVVAVGDEVTVSATVLDTSVPTVTVDASALGGSASLELTKADGEKTLHDDDIYSNTFTVTEPTAEDGPVSLTVSATDSVGLTETGSDSVTLDTTKPTIVDVVVTQQDGDDVVKDGDVVAVSVTVTDATAGIATVTADASAFGGPASLALTDAGDDTYEGTFTVDAGKAEDGTASVSVTVTDGVDNVATSSDSLTLDSTDSVVSAVSVVGADGDEYVTDGDDVVVSVSASDLVSGVASVTVDASALGGSPSLELTKGNDDSYEGTFAVSTPSVKDGLVSLTVTTTDVAGNVVQDSDTVTLDTATPSVSTVSVYDGDNNGHVTVGEEVRVSVTVTDISVPTVTVDASALGGSDSLELTKTDNTYSLHGSDNDVYTGTFTVAEPAVQDGPVSLTVTATDSVGLTDTESGSTSLDTTDPVISTVAVTQQDGDDIVKDGDVVSVTVTASDVTAGVASVTVDASALGGSDSLTLTEGQTSGTYAQTFTVSKPSVQDGPVSLTATVTDDVGLVATDSDSVTLDTTGADVPWVSAAGLDEDDYVTAGDTVVVTAKATDATTGVASLTVDASALGGSDSLELTNQDDGDLYSVSFTVSEPTVYDGSVALTVTTIDVAGNVVTDSDSVTLDTAKPAILTVVVSDGDDDIVTTGDDVTVRATVADTSIPTVTVDASALGGSDALELTRAVKSNSLLVDDHGDVYTATFTVTEPTAEDGPVSLTVSATDSVGFTGTGSDSVTLDTTVPSLTKVHAISKSGGSVVSEGDVVSVTASTTDATAGVTSVTVDASALGGSDSLALTEGQTSGVYEGSFTVASPTAADGPVSLTVTATDAVGLVTTDSGSVTLDTTGPTFSDLSPTTRVSSRTPVISAVVDDETSIDWKSLTVTVEHADETKQYVHDADLKTPGLAFDDKTSTFTLSPKDAGFELDEKATRVTASVADANGNLGTVTWTFGVDVPSKNKKTPPSTPSVVARVDGGIAGVVTDQSDDETSVRIRRATAGSTVNVTFDATDVSNRTTRDGGALSEMSVTFAERADFDFRVEYSPTTFDAETPDPDGQSSVGYLRVDHEMSDASVESVTFTFDVNRSTIEAKNATPESLVLYRLVDGEWVTYDLNLVEETDDTYTFRATVPGLSLFIIGAVEAETDAPIVDAEATTPVETATASADDLSDDAPTDVVTTPETATTSPGFGLVLALVALALCALFAGRRRD